MKASKETHSQFLNSLSLGVFGLLLLLLQGPVEAQETTFRAEPVLLKSEALDAVFLDYNVFQLRDPAALRMAVDRQDTRIKELHLRLGTHYDWELDLTPVPIFSPDFTFRVLTKEGPDVRPFETDIAFEGSITGQFPSEVRLTITGDWITGYIRTQQGKFYIEPLSNLVTDALPGQHVVYRQKDVRPLNGTCGTEQHLSPVSEQEHRQLNQFRADGCRNAQIALAGAYDMVSKYGTPQNVANHLVSIMNLTQPYYIVHGINYTIVDIVVPGSPATDPWPPVQCIDLVLPSFVNWAPGNFNTHDVGQLWVDRNLTRQASGGGGCTDGSLLGRAADIASVCSSDRYNVCENISSAQGRAVLSAHELGHNWGGTHNNAENDDDIMFPTLDVSDLPTGWSATNTALINFYLFLGNEFPCVAAGDCPCDPDNDSPLAWCQDITVDLGSNGTASIDPSDLDAGSNDDCGAVNFFANVTEFDCSDVGQQPSILTVSDQSGNQFSCTSFVTVNDPRFPTAVCRDITVELGNNGQVTIGAPDVDGGSYDNCSVTVSLAADAFTYDCDDVGLQGVELTATDGSGNASQCSATILVEDNSAPEAVCRDITAYLDAGSCVAVIAPMDVDGGSSDACGIDGLYLDKDTFSSAELGENTVELTVIDGSGNASACHATVTVSKRPVILENLGDFTGQYSDRVTLEGRLSDALTGLPLQGRTIHFNLAPFESTATTGVDGVAQVIVRLGEQFPPDISGNAYSVEIAYTGDSCYSMGTDTDAFTVLREDARITYTGKNLASTVSSDAGNAIVALAATICDITNTPDAGSDSAPGDISNATVTFVDRDNGDTPISPPLEVVPLPGDTTKGTVSFVWMTNIGLSQCESFNIGIIVDNYYNRDDPADDQQIVICRPDNHFISGGGNIILENSYGSLPADEGSPCLFNLSANFQGRNNAVAGNVIIRYPSTGTDALRQIQISSIKVASIGIEEEEQAAEFCGSGKVIDVTTGEVLYPAGTFIIRADDNGNPGQGNDEIRFAFYAPNGELVFSSKWAGTFTDMSVLEGGNIVFHSMGNPNVRNQFDDFEEDARRIVAEAYPNPFGREININFTLENAGRTSIEVISMDGSVVTADDLGVLDADIRQQWIFEAPETLNSGTYFYRIDAGSQIAFGKLLLMK